MKFNIFARKQPKPLTGYDLGHHGPADQVYAFAKAAGPFGNKLDVLQGALDAHAAGETENLRQFFTGYLHLKRENGNIATMFNSPLDEGMRNLFAHPMACLLEKTTNPEAVFNDLARDWSSFYRQVALDVTLRRACAENADTVVDCLIRMGADINAHNGRPLFIAIKNRADRISKILVSLNASHETEAFALLDQSDLAYYNRFRNQLTKPETPRPAALPLTPKKLRLEKTPITGTKP